MAYFPTLLVVSYIPIKQTLILFLLKLDPPCYCFFHKMNHDSDGQKNEMPPDTLQRSPRYAHTLYFFIGKTI